MSDRQGSFDLTDGSTPDEDSSSVDERQGAAAQGAGAQGAAAIGGGEGSFEKELSLLEQAVKRLEGGQLALEEAMSEFENGFRSWKRCTEILQNAQKRIEVLCDEAAGTDGLDAWKPASVSGMSDLGVEDLEEGEGPGSAETGPGLQED